MTINERRGKKKSPPFPHALSGFLLTRMKREIHFTLLGIIMVLSWSYSVCGLSLEMFISLRLGVGLLA